ncbi:hypothetical protein D5R81_14305 [Parashewanella spongiae]|uniref:Methylamine utilization protein n=1 Tax=Parashewanella spongiae TaxID=342950 RepID=A0A3A6U0P5_9GAMM|nr:hypothetical protein [Parashewanella spongiae]MCL1079187.1 hypothetical protein [Parashewanella spongiae]RJY10604.1 hypothetical protein D5R81_14305 [Parashewanella spongiae]
MIISNRFWLFYLTIIFSSSTFANHIEVNRKNEQPAVGFAAFLLPKFILDRTQYSASNHVATIIQEHKKFAPYLTVISKNTKTSFVNKDDITHHVYSAIGPERFSFKLKADETNSSISFEESGHVAMGCNVHDWMSGHILVVDTPFYGLTSDTGNIDFSHVPVGEYQLVIWHPQLQSAENRQVEDIVLPLKSKLTIKLQAEMAAIPEQDTLDEFEFLEGY